MINFIFTIILIITLFFSGLVVQAMKKLIKLVSSSILKLLSFFGIKIKKYEQNLEMSNDFKRVYGEIKKVKLSRKNIKRESYID